MNARVSRKNEPCRNGANADEDLLNQELPFSDRTRKLRERLGLSQEGLAEKLGTASRTIQHWEGGSSSPRNLDQNFRELCKSVTRDLASWWAYGPTKKRASKETQEKGKAWQDCLRSCQQALDRFEREQGGMVALQALNADLNRLTDPFLLELGSSGGKALWARGRVCEIDTRLKSGEYLTRQCRRELLTQRELLGEAIGKLDEAWNLYQQRKADLKPIETRYQELVAQAEARALRRIGA